MIIGFFQVQICNWDQNPIFVLDICSIRYLWLDLIKPWSINHHLFFSQSIGSFGFRTTWFWDALTPPSRFENIPSDLYMMQHVIRWVWSCTVCVRYMKLHSTLYFLRNEPIESQIKSFHNTETVYGLSQHDSTGCIAEGRVLCFICKTYCRLIISKPRLFKTELNSFINKESNFKTFILVSLIPIA